MSAASLTIRLDPNVKSMRPAGYFYVEDNQYSMVYDFKGSPKIALNGETVFPRPMYAQRAVFTRTRPFDMAPSELQSKKFQALLASFDNLDDNRAMQRVCDLAGKNFFRATVTNRDGTNYKASLPLTLGSSELDRISELVVEYTGPDLTLAYDLGLVLSQKGNSAICTLNLHDNQLSGTLSSQGSS